MTEQIDFKGLWATIWHAKIALLFSLIASLFLSAGIVILSEKKYESFSVIELKKPDQSQRGFEDVIDSGNVLALSGILPDISQPSGTSFIPKILGNKFLNALVELPDVSRELLLNGFCKVRDPGLISLSGLLDQFGIFKYKKPTEVQRKQLITDCLKEMISIKEYQYNKIKSRAYAIIVESKDPFFSAFLANKMVDFMFEIEDKENREEFKKALLYLSKTEGESQLAVNKSRNALETFLIRNPSNFSVPRDRGVADVASAYSKVNEMQIQELAAKESLITLVNEGINYLKKFLNTTNFEQLSLLQIDRGYAQYSKEFILEIGRLNDLSLPKNLLKPQFIKAITVEIERLRTFSTVINDQIIKTRNEAVKNLKLSEELSVLQLKFATAKIYHENLTKTIRDKTLKAGASGLVQNFLYSTATPATKPSTPNFKTVFFGSAFACLLVGLSIIFAIQAKIGSIFQLSQIGYQYKFRHKILINKKIELSLPSLLNKSTNSKQPELDVGFISEIQRRGRFGCLIEVSSANDTDPENLSLVSLLFAKKFIEKDKAVLCINKTKNGYTLPFLPSPEQNVSEATKLSKLYPEQGKIFISYDEEGLLDQQKPLDISQFATGFSNVFISLDSSQSERLKSSFIEGCDFFIIIGNSGKFNVGSLDQYKTLVQNNEKCLGFVLIN